MKIKKQISLLKSYFRNNTKYTALLAILCILLIVAAVLSVTELGQGTNDHSDASLPPQEKIWYIAQASNLRFIVPEGWVEDVRADTPLPYGYSDPAFILTKNNSPCVIAEVSMDHYDSDKVAQLSFADRIYSNWQQYDGSWYITRIDDTEYPFSGHQRQRINGEYRRSGSLRNDPFILFTRDNSIVPNECNDDLNSLLKTAEPYYESITLTPNISGEIFAEKIWDSATDGSADKSYEQLVFIEKGSIFKKSVMRIPQNTWAGTFYLHDNFLYTFNGSGIYRIDPTTREITALVDLSNADESIRSAYLYSETMYYLVENEHSCSFFSTEDNCTPAKIYSVSINDGAPIFVTNSSKSGTIVGYIESEDAIYISYGYGDAGCLAGTINRISGATEESYLEYSGCVDDPDFENYLLQKEKLEMRINSSKVISVSITYENGQLLPADHRNTDYAIFVFEQTNK